jgi:hypothetical protein
MRRTQAAPGQWREKPHNAWGQYPTPLLVGLLLLALSILWPGLAPNPFVFATLPVLSSAALAAWFARPPRHRSDPRE